MGESSLPFSRVYTPIIPSHISLTLSHVFAKIPFICVAIRPKVLARTIFAITTKLSDIFITILTDPLSLAFSKTIQKLTFVECPIGPMILSFSMRFPMNVISFVKISVGEILDPIPMLHKMRKLT